MTSSLAFDSESTNVLPPVAGREKSLTALFSIGVLLTGQLNPNPALKSSTNSFVMDSPDTEIRFIATRRQQVRRVKRETPCPAGPGYQSGLRPPCRWSCGGGDGARAGR